MIRFIYYFSKKPLKIKNLLFRDSFSITFILAIFTWVLTYPGLGISQDSHYWIHQYGTRADLLSGLVVGSVKDLSSTYYNPGAIPLSPEQSLIITTDAFEYSRITAKDGAGTGVNLTSTQGGSAPGIFAVRLTSSKAMKNHWVASFLTRYDSKFQVDGRRIDDRTSTNISNPAQEYFSGEVFLKQKLDEFWGGVTYGRNLSKETAFGITQYISYRDQRGRHQAIGQSLALRGEGTSFSYYQDYVYYNIRTLWKFGMAFDYRPLSFGFTLTTPSVSLFGSGSTLLNFSAINPDTSIINDGESVLISNYQKDLDATYQSPLAIALGVDYRYKKTSLYFTLEWFSKVDRFNVLKPGDFIAQSSGETVSQDYQHELKSVINFGFGYQHTFHEGLSMYGSIINDRSARIKDSQTPFAISNWDIFHITVGSALTFWRLDLTMGLTYSFGRDQFDRVVNFGDDYAREIIEDRVVLKDIYYRRIKVIIGFSLLSANRSQN